MHKTSTYFGPRTILFLTVVAFLRFCVTACGKKSDTVQQSAALPTPAFAATATRVAEAAQVGTASPVASPTAEASTPGGRVKGVALISVQLTSLTLANGKSVNISTNVIERQAKSTKLIQFQPSGSFGVFIRSNTDNQNQEI